MSYKLGKLAAKNLAGLSTLSVYAQGKIPNPPHTVKIPREIPAYNWGVLGNDQYGDCTYAGLAHLLMAWNSEVKEHDPVPDAETVVKDYLVKSPNDQGLAEADVLSDFRTEGIFGSKCLAYVQATQTIKALQQVIAFYGGAYMGVALPESAQQQFVPGRPSLWTPVPNSPIEGGHCIVAVGYNPHAVQVVTWGQIVDVTYPWIMDYMDEVWAVIPHEFQEAGHGPSLDIKALVADLDALK